MTTTGPSTGRPNIVPYITPWSGELDPLDGLPLAITRRGLVYTDEGPYDRDAHGVLWKRAALHPGEGRADFGAVHPNRQRRIMRKLLCQVCAGPADRNAAGVLWLLHDDRGDWPGWPEEMGATHPPVCLPCARLSVRWCPHLRDSHIAVRARSYEATGVYGARYEPAPGGVTAADDVIIAWGSPQIRWVLATQAVRTLRGCTVVDLDAEPGTAQ